MNPNKPLVLFFFGFCFFAAIAAASEENCVSIGSYAPEMGEISLDNSGVEVFEGTLQFWEEGKIPISENPNSEINIKIPPGGCFIKAPDGFGNGWYATLTDENGEEISHRRFNFN